MKKVLVLGAVLAMAAVPALGAMTFDFNDGMQGWQWYHGADSRIPYADGQWIAPGVQPLIYTDGAGTDIYGAPGGGNLFTPGDANSRATAILKLADICVGGTTQSFQMQVDVYIPNLRPLTGFPNSYPGNMNQFTGMWANPVGTDWGVGMYGRPDKGSQCYYNATPGGDWVERRQEWYMEDWTGGAYLTPDSLWWNTWITLSLDWNFSTPGRVIAKYYLPWTTYNGRTGWITLRDEAAGSGVFDEIMIGSIVTTAGTPWSKCQFDNVVFDSPDLIPEPASLLLLGLGGMALLRRRVR